MSRTPSSIGIPEPKQLTTRPRGYRLRLVPLVVGALAMALGLWTGLTRLGVRLPGGVPSIAIFHSALMICGFLGTLISLERAVALGRQWAYAAPIVSSIGALVLLAGMPRLAALAFILASAIFLSASVNIAIRQRALFTAVLAIAAACWTIGISQWLLDYSMASVAGWWLNFLVLTIAAERLELGRMASPPASSQVTFAGVVMLLLIGSARGELGEPWAPFMAAGLLGCATWLLYYDLARRTVRIVGQPRFSAISILAGHVWLGIAGILLIVAPPGTTAFSYDAAVHAIAIGFVLSMIFGHAPIILPAVTGMRLRHSSFAYGSLALLHVSVLVRVGGDMFEWLDLRALSGVITVLALVGYAATLVLASTIWRRAA